MNQSLIVSTYITIQCLDFQAATVSEETADSVGSWADMRVGRSRVVTCDLRTRRRVFEGISAGL